MSFFNKVKETASSAVQSTGEMLEVAKLNLDVRSAEDKINGLFAKMGKLVFASYEAEKVEDPDMVELCEKVKESYVGVEELRKKILELRNKKMCTECKAELNDTDPFCNKCGAAQSE
ncbi:MAG: hypothetical protein WCQ41_00020 [Bacillota bacterium]